jgi:hypothetical protein
MNKNDYLWYYNPKTFVWSKLVDGHIFDILNVLVKNVKASLAESRLTATTTFFTNCMNLMKPIFEVFVKVFHKIDMDKKCAMN